MGAKGGWKLRKGETGIINRRLSLQITLFGGAGATEESKRAPVRWAALKNKIATKGKKKINPGLEEKCCREGGKKEGGREWQGDPLPRFEHLTGAGDWEAPARRSLGKPDTSPPGPRVSGAAGGPAEPAERPAFPLPAARGPPASADGWQPRCPPALTAIHIYTHTHTHTHIYIYRKREREIRTHTYIHNMYVCVCVRA